MPDASLKKKAWLGLGLGDPRRVGVAAGLCAILLLALLRILLPGPFVELRHSGFDLLQTIAPRAYVEAPVRVIDIDDASLARIGQWPWSRDTMARLTERLQEMGAAAIAFDVLFAESDRTSPRALLADLQRRGISLGEGVTGPEDLPDNDETFAEVLSRGATVTGFALTAEANGASPAAKAGFALLGDDPGRGLKAYSGAAVTLAILQDAAAGNGNFALPAEDARTVRALPMLSRLGDAIVPSLALEALRVAQEATSIAVRATESGTASIGALSALTARIGALDVPLAADGSYPLRFTGPVPGRTIPAWKVLDETSDLTPAAIGGRIHLVGSSAVGLADLRPTPLNPFEPGVEIHAAALEQMILGAHLQRPIFAPAAELLSGVAAGLLVLLLVGFAPLPIAVLGTLALVAGAFLGSLAAFDRANLLLDAMPAVSSASLVFVVAILSRIVATERDKSRLRHAFGHYLSPEMVRELSLHPERLKLSGQTREMTFLFTDLEGFTSFTESVEPEVLVRVLNLYLAEMCAIVTRHGGTIDKIVGDAVHAMFNAPLDQPDHADRAVACALAILAFSETFAAERKAEGLAIGVTRIGVNTGFAVVGNFGGAGRFDYTAHGDAINTAARLEAANKALGTRLCVSGMTAAKATRFRFRPIGTLMLRGKSEGVAAFEPLAPEAPEPAAYLQAFSDLAGMGAEAGRAMIAFSQAHPSDVLADLHAKRLRSGQSGQAIALG